MEKRRKRIRIEETVVISDVDGSREAVQVRYVAPPKIPPVPQRKLSFSLVPVSLWKQNLRAFIPKSQWDNLRHAIVEYRGNRCEVCGERAEKPHAHEEWLYDSDGIPAIARLIGIGIQCKLCHQAEHIGLTNSFHLRGLVSDEELQEVREHYCRVNSIPKTMIDGDHTAKIARWEALNKFPWEVDWGSYAPLLGGRVGARDFSLKVEMKYNTLIATPTKNYGLTPHIGLARPFGTRLNRMWAVPYVQPKETKRISPDCIIVGYVFITRGVVLEDMKAQGDALVGQPYKRWITIEDDRNLLDFIGT